MNSECWLEMDLYWFQGGPPQAKATELFDRLTPIWNRKPEARKGLTLCVGWLMDTVLLWRGELDDAIFTCRPPTYERWTYRRLAELVACIRREATARGISDFHVGMIVLGGKGAAEGAPRRPRTDGWGGRTQEPSQKTRYHHVGRWFHEHPEVRDPRYMQHFFWGARVEVKAGDGPITPGAVPLWQYFADKWADMARAVGLDALVLRDNVLSPEYYRGGEATRYKDPAARRDLTAALLHLLERLKRNMPAMVLIGYSSGGSAIEDWRCHGFDLEPLARSGHLDLWVTQTWASAWQDYWPCHAMGYTFQLATQLTHAAMLADTPCKHLFLVEAFDAWEPWDTIHQYPSKLSWEVWAYSHAAVRLPGGQVRRAAGFYSSWMNRQDQLLDPESVEFLVSTFNAASEDLEDEPCPGGPCVVFHRQGLEWLMDHPADYCHGEAFDDWTAMLQKFGLPILSITRSEWLELIGPVDSLIVPAAAELPEQVCDDILDRLRAGTPVLWMGQARFMPDSLRSALGVATLAEPVTESLASPATLEDAALAQRFGTRGLVIHQRARSLDDSPQWRPVIRCLGGPVVARHTRWPAWIWETPEWGTPDELHLSVQSVQSLQTYAAIAEAFVQTCPSPLRWRSRRWTRPTHFGFWRYADDAVGVLLGNLETGLTGHSQFYVQGTLEHDGALGFETVAFGGPPTRVDAEAGGVALGLEPHHACVLRLVHAKKTDAMTKDVIQV